MHPHIPLAWCLLPCQAALAGWGSARGQRNLEVAMFKQRSYLEKLAGRLVRTTLPVALAGDQGPDDPRRAPSGPPRQGLEQLVHFCLLEVPKMGLHLTAVPAEQLARVRADRFEGAAEYIGRIIHMMQRGGAVLPQVPFSAQDLEARLRRCQVLDELEVILGELRELVLQSAHLEWSDLLKMADFLMKDVEAQMERPSVPEALRRQLATLAAVPLETWRSWLRARRQRQVDNEGIRTQVRLQLEEEMQRLRA
ncbi:MAG: hypothetical protein NZ890_05390, partial [Myxococcota bacterium]|nr:hypothetical protein [Myxococcota bacterium]